jgi:hypothetical protein
MPSNTLEAVDYRKWPLYSHASAIACNQWPLTGYIVQMEAHPKATIWMPKNNGNLYAVVELLQ